MQTRRIFILSIVNLLLIGAAIPPLLGQGETIITITAPGWVSHVFSPELFAPFEAQHPGVKVVVTDSGQDYYYPSAGEDIEKHLDGAQKYASYADVIYVDKNIASVEATRAGDFMNLAPFISADTASNTDDFFPKIWQSAQWDDGTWYIPASAYVGMLIYDKKAFDQAGLTYPSEKWTFDEFAHTVRALTTYDKNGKVITPGFTLYDPGLFFYGLTGKSFYDASVSPSAPKFDNPDLSTFYEQWKALEKDITTQETYDYDKMAFSFGTPWRLNNRSGGSQQWAATALPGGVTSLSIEGFAVSGGTLNPEMAYALANFASTSPEIVDAFGGDTPARRSLVNANTKSATDIQAIDAALEKAVPISELRFEDYIEAAINKEPAGGVPLDFKAAIQGAEITAVKALDTATARKGTATVYVITPVPTPALAENQTVIRFGLGVDKSTNQEAWNQLTSDFLAANPTVGNVDFVTDFFEPKDRDKLDCYYLPFNEVPSMTLEKFLPLDPFMDADASFDRSDFIGTTLDQVQRNNHIWAYPMMIQPSVLWYNQEMFTKAGLPSPEQGWTVDGFKDALQTLKPMLDKPNDPVFVSGTYGNTYLVMLIAAYGGVPYDYRTSPPTINFTDPTTVDAIRQVLDLAKKGYIGYQPLFAPNKSSSDYKAAITDDVLTTDNWHFQNRANPDNKDYSRVANYPQGSQLIPVAYNVGSAYIHANAQNPDACYKWIAHIAKRPDLLNGMPARASQMNDPIITAAQGADVTALYRGFMDTFQKPNVIAFPGQYNGDSSFNSYVEPLWLNRVFDNYVLHDGDLDKDLAEAETFAKGYRECASVIPEMNPELLTTQEESTAYYRQFADCAIKIDPTMKDQFSYLYDGATSSAAQASP